MQRMSNKLTNIRVLLLMLFAAVSLSVSAQNITITGNVKDKSGETIIGASVVEKGTTNGVMTDLNGNFTIKVSGKRPLSVTYIGMKPQEIALKGKTRIDIVLEDDAITLNDVVVIGYGTVAKKDLTGSVASISSKDLASIPVTNAAEAITGKLAGVQVTTTEGSPDAEIKIRVRGGGSLSQDNSPLYIVDGFPVSSISDIAPTDIQSIDVLKDASSTAIYGARGANGVIIITTKSGKEGKVQVSLNASFGVKKIVKELNVMNPYEYVMYQYELDPQTGGSPTTFNSYYGVYNDLNIYKSDKGTNWQDQVFGRTGNQQDYNLSVSGGSKATKFNLSFTRSDEKSIMIGSGFEKNNINAKINTEINKWLSLDFNTRLSYQVINGASVSDGSGSNTKLRNAVKYAPTKGLRGFDPNLDDEDTNSAESASLLYDPVQSVNDEYRKQKKFANYYNLGLNWDIMKGLRARAEGGYNFIYTDVDNVYGPSTSTSKNNGGQPILVLGKNDSQSWRQAVTLTYDKQNLLEWKDKLNLMIGEEMSSSQATTTTAESRYFPSDMSIGEILANPSYGKPQPTLTDINADDRLFSFFGRANYIIKDKYLFTVTMRADGSSKFAEGNRWGYFPSAAAAWRISDESFMEPSKNWLSNLKFRLSYGAAGNNRIPTSYQQIYSASTSKFYYPGEEIANQLEPSSYLPNPNLKWETTYTRNAGFDFGFFKNRLSGTLDLYWNTTKDLLIQAPVAANSGYKYQYQNIGQTSNKGIELTLQGYIVDTKDYSLSATFNIAFNKNKIDKFRNGDATKRAYSSGWNGSAEPSEDFLVEQGGQIGQIYGYVNDGMYSFDDFTFNPGTNKWVLNNGVADNSAITSSGNYFGPGALKFKNVDGSADNKVDQKDKTVIGNTNPIHTGGFSLSGRYKNLDVSAFFNWSYGNDIYNANKLDYSAQLLSRKYQNLVSDMDLAHRFTTIDPQTGYNIYYGANANPARLQEINKNASIWMPLHTTTPLHSWAVEDGSFLRLNNVSVGYSLPKSLIKKLQLESLRIYVTGYNLYCWTKYTGFDPEVDTRSKNNPLTPGVDYSAYPKSRSFVGGINLTF